MKEEHKLKSKRWQAKGIINSIDNKNMLFELAIKDKTVKVSAPFKTFIDLLNRVIKSLKDYYINNC